MIDTPEVQHMKQRLDEKETIIFEQSNEIKRLRSILIKCLIYIDRYDPTLSHKGSLGYEALKERKELIAEFKALEVNK